jgi:hypothetical protein
VPIGIRIGNFLLFREAEIGADMTNNVLASHADAQSDIGAEVKPRVRLDSDWSRHSLSFEANADRIWYDEFPIADVKNYQLLMRGRLDVTSVRGFQAKSKNRKSRKARARSVSRTLPTLPIPSCSSSTQRRVSSTPSIGLP